MSYWPYEYPVSSRETLETVCTVNMSAVKHHIGGQYRVILAVGNHPNLADMFSTSHRTTILNMRMTFMKMLNV